MESVQTVCAFLILMHDLNEHLKINFVKLTFG
jgi:hypothetical protein